MFLEKDREQFDRAFGDVMLSFSAKHGTCFPASVCQLLFVCDSVLQLVFFIERTVHP